MYQPLPKVAYPNKKLDFVCNKFTNPLILNSRARQKLQSAGFTKHMDKHIPWVKHGTGHIPWKTKKITLLVFEPILKTCY